MMNATERKFTTLLGLAFVLAIGPTCSKGNGWPDGGQPDGNVNDAPPVCDPVAGQQVPAGAIAAEDLTYSGAFRLPDGTERPQVFDYGGNAMTFWANGDPTGPDDGHPGSLFVTGHPRLPYGELPDGSRVAEVSIPAPAVADHPSELPQAEFLQPLSEVTQGMFDGLDELPRIGLAVLGQPGGAQLHLTWGAHFQEPPQPSHGFVSMDLSAPAPQGPWYVGDARLYAVNGYLFSAPAAWADAHTSGRRLITGRYRDGGWGGKGPALFAYDPFEAGGPPAAGARLAATRLLQYADSEDDAEPESHSLACYQHADSWEGAEFVTTGDDRQAVVFSGTKGTGEKYWYGWVNPEGAELPCIEESLVDQFTTCWTAAGEPCPAADLHECRGHNDYRGWWASRADAVLLFYDPADLARVASGDLDPHAPQPYAMLDLDAHMFLNPDTVEPDMLGVGNQRLNRLGAMAYDPAGQHLYVLELFADGAKPVVHVFSVE